MDETSSKIVLTDEPAATASAPAAPKKEEKKENKDVDSDDDDDDDDVVDEMPPPPPVKKRQSVSAEAYGAFNQRQAYQKKVVPKDDAAKQRIRDVLAQSWMFKTMEADNINTIVDAMSERIIEADTKIINRGDDGSVMWIIEEGKLECSKPIDGVEKMVKTCGRGDIFGELALLYS